MYAEQQAFRKELLGKQNLIMPFCLSLYFRKPHGSFLQCLQDRRAYLRHGLYSGGKPLVILIFRFVFIPSFTHFVDNGFDPGQGKFQFFPGRLTFSGNQVPCRLQCMNTVSQQTVLRGSFWELR